MLFKEALEKSEKLRAVMAGPVPATTDRKQLWDLITADAKLTRHCRETLPRLLAAIERYDALSMMEIAPGTQDYLDLAAAQEEYDAAVAAAAGEVK